MPRSRLPPEEQQRQQLLEALRPALDGTPRRLQGTPRAPGLFAGGQAGATLARRALDEGLVAQVTAPDAGGRRAAPVLVVVTDRGRRFVLDADRPVKVLEALSAGLETRGAALAAEVQAAQARLGEIREQAEALRRELEAHFAAYQQTAGVLRDAIDAAARAPAPAPAPAADGAWAAEVPALVAEFRRRNAFDRPTLPRLYDELRTRWPALTLGQFHDGLRRLHEERRVRLAPYTQNLATLPDARNALYLDREVMYYVDLP